MVDMVNRPPHYLQGGIEAIDVIKSRLTKEEFIGYLKGCKMKYDLRYPFKDNPEQDLEKSDWYKNKLLEVIVWLLIVGGMSWFAYGCYELIDLFFLRG